jgi:leucyl aminopeptidase
MVLDNGPARSVSHAQQLQSIGEELGEMFEITTIRKEDFAFHRGEFVRTCYSFPL